MLEVVKIVLPLGITMNSHYHGMIGLAQMNTYSFVKNWEAKVCFFETIYWYIYIINQRLSLSLAYSRNGLTYGHEILCA